MLLTNISASALLGPGNFFLRNAKQSWPSPPAALLSSLVSPSSKDKKRHLPPTLLGLHGETLLVTQNTIGLRCPLSYSQPVSHNQSICSSFEHHPLLQESKQRVLKLSLESNFIQVPPDCTFEVTEQKLNWPFSFIVLQWLQQPINRG